MATVQNTTVYDVSEKRHQELLSFTGLIPIGNRLAINGHWYDVVEANTMINVVDGNTEHDLEYHVVPEGRRPA